MTVPPDFAADRELTKPITCIVGRSRDEQQRRGGSAAQR
jgi:hypothetical protein